MNTLTHISSDNRPEMVDVGNKSISLRTASAEGFIKLNETTLNLICDDKIKKGNVLITAELAGIQGGKRTSELIPLCHNILISKIHVKATIAANGVKVVSEASCTGKTGIEMEALTAVNIALLTIYDMCKAVDKEMIIENVQLKSKNKTPIQGANNENS